MKRPSRTPSILSASLHRQLNMYALAASAAGVSLLAAQPGEAKIVYTPAHAKVVFGQPLPVDLNHDGIVDFYLVQERNASGDRLSACQYRHSFISSIGCSSSRGTNGIRTTDLRGRKFGAALPYGEKIQRGDQFAKRNVLLGGDVPGTGTNTLWYGPWVNRGKGVKHRYLGLKFKIKGRFHFGWARLTVATSLDMWTATLTGYAYETVPGKAIVAGKTEGRDEADIEELHAYETVPNEAIIAGQTKGPEEGESRPASATRDAPTAPVSLGLLAMGAPGLSIWRREELPRAARRSSLAAN